VVVPLNRWLAEYGAPVLFFAQTFGIFGLPIPDELLLTIAGALLRQGVLSVPATVAGAIAGCLTGISLSYMLGRWAGPPLLNRMSRYHASATARAQAWFSRFGLWLVAVGYFIPGVRHVSAITVGSSNIGFMRFASYAYPGGVAWCSVFLMAGYYGGDRWREVAMSARSPLGLVALATACAAAVYLTVRGRNRR
jgi:membrane protein DedA with SNARE-associated domain